MYLYLDFLTTSKCYRYVDHSTFAYIIQLYTGFYRLFIANVVLEKKVHKWTLVKSTAVSSGEGKPTLSKMSPLKLDSLNQHYFKIWNISRHILTSSKSFKILPISFTYCLVDTANLFYFAAKSFCHCQFDFFEILPLLFKYCPE